MKQWVRDVIEGRGKFARTPELRAKMSVASREVWERRRHAGPLPPKRSSWIKLEAALREKLEASSAYLGKPHAVVVCPATGTMWRDDLNIEYFLCAEPGCIAHNVRLVIVRVQDPTISTERKTGDQP